MNSDLREGEEFEGGTGIEELLERLSQDLDKEPILSEIGGALSFPQFSLPSWPTAADM